MLILKKIVKRNSENAIGSYSILKCCTYVSCGLPATTIEMELVFGYVAIGLLIGCFGGK